MDALLRDLRYGLKLLGREKAFSLTVLLTLAVCIGANVMIFSVVHTVVLKPLPYPDSHRLVTVFNSYPGAGVERGSNGTIDYFQRRERIDAFEEVAIFQGSGATVGEPGAIERVSSMRVTPSFFTVLGADAALGRTFTEDEVEPGNDRKLVLTHGYWQEGYGGDPAILGREIRVDGRPYAVVGVMSEGFRVTGRPDTRFFEPIGFTERERTMDVWHSNNFQMFARLAPGASVEQARAQNEALNRALTEQWPVPNGAQILEDAGYHTEVALAQDDFIRDVRGTLYLLWAGAGFVLLIGCVNIANLILARSQVRAGELATRQALGAGRRRLSRQILTEAVLMSFVGSALGLGLGLVGIGALSTLGIDTLPRGSEVAVTGPVLGFTAALALGAGILFGAIPAFQILRSDLNAVFRSETRTGTASRRAMMLRSALVTGQVALAFLLLRGAGLMFASFRAAVAVEPGFEPQGVLTGFVSLPSSRYPDGSARRQLVDELLRDVRALPAVEAASLTTQLPFSGNNSSSVVVPEGYTPQPGESLLSPYQTWVAPGYFEAMGIEVRAGRVFEPSDGPDAANVMVIDRWLADRYWPDSDPVGKRMITGEGVVSDSVPEEALFTIVGVVETVKQNDLTASGHTGAYYFSYRQSPNQGFLTLVARAGTEPASLTSAVRATLTRLDPELPFFGVKTMESRIEESLTGRRTPMLLLAVFAGVALFLAVVGIYGSLAYSVTQRTREMGIRMAMGSPPEKIFNLVVAQGLRVTLVGLILGGVGAFALAGFMRSLVYGVEPTSPGVMAGVAATLGVVGVLACAVPAFRATRVDPTTALHQP